MVVIDLREPQAFAHEGFTESWRGETNSGNLRDASVVSDGDPRWEHVLGSEVARPSGNISGVAPITPSLAVVKEPWDSTRWPVIPSTSSRYKPIQSGALLC